MGEGQEKGRKTWVQSKISSLLAGIRDVQLHVDGGQQGQALGNPGSGVGGGVGVGHKTDSLLPTLRRRLLSPTWGRRCQAESEIFLIFGMALTLDLVFNKSSDREGDGLMASPTQWT